MQLNPNDYCNWNEQFKQLVPHANLDVYLHNSLLIFKDLIKVLIWNISIDVKGEFCNS
jgi:hypothetical protein